MKTAAQHIASASLTASLHFAGIGMGADDGLWQTYDGRGMVMDLFGDGPLLAVIDLQTLAWNGRTPALDEHEEEHPVGWWEGTAVAAGADGSVLTQRLHLLPPPAADDPAAAEWTEHHYRAAGIRGLLRSGMPLEASVRVMPDATRAGVWESITQPVEVNGRMVDPAALRLPVVVLRRGILRETSICTLGRSLATGQLAARLANPPAPLAPSDFPAANSGVTPPPSAANPTEPIIMDLKERMAALLEQHGENHKTLILEQLVNGATDEDIAALIEQALAALKDEELAAAKAELEKKEEAVAALTASLAEKDAALAKAQGELSQRRQPPGPQGVAAAAAVASLRRSAMTESERLAYADKHGAEALRALPY